MGTKERLTPPMWVPVAEVRLSERRRRSVSAATVERYRDWLDQGREPPPVRLARSGDGFVVRDGRHRVVAAVSAGYAVIEAELSQKRPARVRLSAMWRLVGRLTRNSQWLERRRASAAARATNSGTKLCRQSTSLAPRRSGFDSRRLHRRPKSGSGSAEAMATSAGSWPQRADAGQAGIGAA